MSSLKLDHTVEIDKAVDYVNDRLPLDDSFVTVKAPDSNPIKSLNKASVPSELITQCVATLFIIQVKIGSNLLSFVCLLKRLTSISSLL